MGQKFEFHVSSWKTFDKTKHSGEYPAVRLHSAETQPDAG